MDCVRGEHNSRTQGESRTRRSTVGPRRWADSRRHEFGPERGQTGAPTAIVSADGVTTTLGLDANGYIDEIAYPTGEAYEFESDASGLMQSMETPRGLVHEFDYNGLGPLIRDDDPEGGFQTLARTDAEGTSYAVEHATALGRTSTYAVSRSPKGERTRRRGRRPGPMERASEERRE